MPDIAPFRALGYAPHLRADLDRLVAPPYDVQSEEQRARLAARHEHNIVHVDLPRPPAGEDPYEAARRRLAGWARDGILTRDVEPAYYVCEQRYRPPAGGEAVRRGFFGRKRRLVPADAIDQIDRWSGVVGLCVERDSLHSFL